MFDCSVCTEEFNSTDEVFSTTCGHIFHQHCLQDWVTRSATCPQCRHENPESHQIFLNFDEAAQRQRENSDLRARLLEKEKRDSSADESHIIEVSKLESQLEQSEKICFELQEKIEYFVAQHESIQQENVLKVVEVNDLQAQLRSHQENILQKTKENDELRKSLSERDSQISSSIALQESIANDNLFKITEIDDLQMQIKVVEETVMLQAIENEELRKKLSERESEIISQIPQQERLMRDNLLKTNEISDLQLKVKALEDTLLQQAAENEKMQKALRECDGQRILITEMDDLSKNIRLLSEYSNRQMHIMQLSENEGVQTFAEERQHNTRKLHQVQQECIELQHRLRSKEEEKNVLFEQNNTLEDKLKKIQLELQNEIDKMKLPSLMDQVAPPGGILQHKDALTLVAAYNKPVKNVAEEDNAQKRGADTTAPASIRSLCNGVIIKGVKGNCSPRETVLKLCQKMQLCIGEDDVEEAMIDYNPNNQAVIVGFKTKTPKDLFLANAHKLKYSPTTQYYVVCDYVDTFNKSTGLQMIHTGTGDDKVMDLPITCDKEQENSPKPSHKLSPPSTACPKINLETVACFEKTLHHFTGSSDPAIEEPDDEIYEDIEVIGVEEFCNIIS